MDGMFFGKCSDISLSPCPDERWGGFYIMDVQTSLSLHTSAHRVMVKQSVITNPDNRLSLLSFMTIDEREAFAYYSGSLIYSKPINERHMMKTCGKGVMQKTAKASRK